MRGVDSESGASATAMPGRRARLWPGLLVLLIGALIFAIDQWSKGVALRELAIGERVPVVGDVLGWRLVFNPGAAFSLGESITPVFTTFQALVSVAMIVLAPFVRSTWWAVALGLVLGGASGNLYDRLFRPPSFGHGHVVDFIALPNFPVFNVADMSITTAAVLIIIASFAGWDLFGAPSAVPVDDARSDEEGKTRG